MVVVTATATTIVLVATFATIGAAPFSYQQGASDRSGPRITSANIVDGEVKNQDLAADAVTSDKIQNGQVKEEDLDPSIELGGESGGFSLQVTERSSSIRVEPEGEIFQSVSVQCNPDETVTGGGFSQGERWNDGGIAVVESKRQDDGWSATWFVNSPYVLEVYAECLKVVNEGTTTG